MSTLLLLALLSQAEVNQAQNTYIIPELGLFVVQTRALSHKPEELYGIVKALEYHDVKVDLSDWTLQFVDLPIQAQLFERGQIRVRYVPGVTYPTAKTILIQVREDSPCAVQSSWGHELIHVALFQAGRDDWHDHNAREFQQYNENWRDEMFAVICEGKTMKGILKP